MRQCWLLLFALTPFCHFTAKKVPAIIRDR